MFLGSNLKIEIKYTVIIPQSSEGTTETEAFPRTSCYLERGFTVDSVTF